MTNQEEERTKLNEEITKKLRIEREDERIRDLKRLEREAHEVVQTSHNTYSRIDARKIYDRLRVERLKLESKLILEKIEDDSK